MLIARTSTGNTARRQPQKGYIKEEIKPDGSYDKKITAKTERAIRKNALNQIFGQIRKKGAGTHKTNSSGLGDEHTGDLREFRFGDALENINITESLKNAQVNHGFGNFEIFVAPDQVIRAIRIIKEEIKFE